MSVRRHLAVARRVGRGAAPAGRYGLGSRVLGAREPKLLRASTRLSAARTRVAPAPAAVLSRAAAPTATMPGAPALRPATAPSPLSALAPTSSPASVSPGVWEESGNYSDLLPARSAEHVAPPPPTLARAPTTPAPAGAPASGPPPITPESLGIGPASFEWLFGDPDKALAHPDVTASPVASLPPMSPEQRSAHRLARLTARGGTPYGRGAQISEGPAEPPAPAAPVDRAVATGSSAPAERPASEAPSPSPVAESPAAVIQRVAREEAPSPEHHEASPPPPSPDVTPSAPSRPARQRLVAGRRPAAPPTPAAPPAPATPPARELARATADTPTTPHTQPHVITGHPASPVETPAIPVSSAAGRPVRPAPGTLAPPRTPPPPPSPGPPPVRPIASPRRAPTRPQIVRRRPTQAARLTIHRAPRPAPAAPAAPTSAPPAHRSPSLFRRALAALTQRPQPAPKPADGDRVDKYVTPAPMAPTVRPVARPARPVAQTERTVARMEYSVARPHARMARREQRPAQTVARMSAGAPLSSSPQPWASPDDVAPRATSPQPPLRVPAELSSQRLSRALAAPVSSPTPHTPAMPQPHMPSMPHMPATPQPHMPATPQPHMPSMPHMPATPQPHMPAAPPPQTATAPSSPTDPDLAYRDLLTRVREEREQLGQLISHPF